jgi:hypothetical protein
MNEAHVRVGPHIPYDVSIAVKIDIRDPRERRQHDAPHLRVRDPGLRRHARALGVA